MDESHKNFIEWMDSKPIIIHYGHLPTIVKSIDQSDNLTLRGEETNNYRTEEEFEEAFKKSINTIIELETLPVSTENIIKQIDEIEKGYQLLSAYLKFRNDGLKTQEECKTWLKYERKENERKKNFKFSKWWRNWSRNWLAFGRIVSLSIFREIRRIYSKHR